MANKRLIILLTLLGCLLVVLLTGIIRGQIKRISDYKLAIASRAKAVRKVDDRPPIKPTAASQAVDRIRAARGTNIVICVLDAARPDHMGCYGYPRRTTPNIDRLAKDSLVFEQHYCQFPLTDQSTRALFESRYIVPTPLSCDSLVSSFQRLGFNTMLFVANPRIAGIGPSGRGFDNIESNAQLSIATRVQQRKQIAPKKPAKEQEEEDYFYKPEYLLADIKSWLANRPKQPFFAYVHFIPPHVPYAAPKNIKDIFLGKKPPLYWKAPLAMLPGGKEKATPGASAKSIEDTLNLYDANMRWADVAVGKLEQALRKAGLFDNTLLVIAADHGEALGEHGYNWHPNCPYDETLHIPLIIRFPGKDRPRGRVKALTQTIDLLPTLLDLHNKPWPATAQGRSLLPLLAGETNRVNEYSFSAAGQDWLSAFFVVRDLQSTLLLSDDGKTRALYDSVTDPHQTKNIIKSEPARAAKLVEAFRQFALAQADPPLYFLDPTITRKASGASEQSQTQDMPERLKKQLKTLGYLK